MTALQYIKDLNKEDGESWSNDTEALIRAFEGYANRKLADYFELLKIGKTPANKCTRCWGSGYVQQIAWPYPLPREDKT